MHPCGKRASKLASSRESHKCPEEQVLAYTNNILLTKFLCITVIAGSGLTRSKSVNRQRLANFSTAMESIQADVEPIDHDEDVP